MKDSPLANDQELDRLIDRMCDQIATDDELAALGKRLVEDPDACEHYLACLELHGRLAWQMMPGKPFSSEELLCFAQADGETSSQPSIPPIIPDLSPASHPSLVASLFTPGSFVFSYTAAGVLLTLVLLVGWTWKISQDQKVAGSAPREAPRAVGREIQFVGRITGMVDCRFDQRSEISDPKTQGPRPKTLVSLGDKLALVSGLIDRKSVV
jgi:hypothetical protein